MKKLKVLFYINIFLAVIFTFLCLSFRADISLVAFPLSLIFTIVLAYVTFVVLLKKDGVLHMDAIRRFYQYEPFVYISAFVLQRAGNYGQPYLLDVSQAIVWTLITILSFVILYYLNEKRVYSLKPEWEEIHKKNPRQKAKGLKRVGIEILEWVDALIQAAFTIVLLNIFVFQLYEIPSESMVPTFLIGDRVAVVKTMSGPKFPLSDAGLPYLQDYKRGDVVVFRNPHYSNDRKNEVKTFMSQFVYMLTLTLVNPNKFDEYGRQKADPLVKRVTGLPGEQLLLMDGKLYSRTRDSDFKVVDEDSGWALWNINDMDSSTKAKVQDILPAHLFYPKMLEIEQKRRDLNLEDAKKTCEDLAERFNSIIKKNGIQPSSSLKEISGRALFVNDLFTQAGNHTVSLLTEEGGGEWFDSFLNSWHKNMTNLSAYTENGPVTGDHLVGGDLYSDSLFRLNLMCKILFGQIVVRTAELLSDGVSPSDWDSDVERTSYIDAKDDLCEYIEHMDARNMGLFPANNSDGSPSYIPDNCYFMMGDNRFNSLDMRHRYEKSIKDLVEDDPYSVKYGSYLEPQYVSRTRMLGKAVLRFWPLGRFGTPGKNNISGKK
ncbi:MAG: signal peptidase I [Treponema sp.]|nr:signal peptidase I [Treponema sp.]